MPQHQKPSCPVTQAAPIFITVLFLLAFFGSLGVPASAAFIIYPPRMTDNSTVYANGTLESSPCCFEKYTYCVDGDTKAVEGQTSVWQYMDNDTYSLTNFTSHTEVRCQNGCSTTLNDCRLNTFWDNIGFIAFVFISGLLIWFGVRFGPVGTILTIATMILSLTNLTWDVFSFDPLIVRLFSIAVIIFGVIMLCSQYTGDEEES